MNEKQKRFVEEYLIDLNATQAYIRSGYSSKDANVNSSILMANHSIKDAIDKAIAERSKRTGVNQDRVVLELAKLAFVNIVDLVNFDDATIKETATRDDTAALLSIKVKETTFDNGSSIEREVKIADKTKNLELLGKHVGMFKDNLNITGVQGMNFIYDFPDNEDE